MNIIGTTTKVLFLTIFIFTASYCSKQSSTPNQDEHQTSSTAHEGASPQGQNFSGQQQMTPGTLPPPMPPMPSAQPPAFNSTNLNDFFHFMQMYMTYQAQAQQAQQSYMGQQSINQQMPQETLPPMLPPVATPPYYPQQQLPPVQTSWPPQQSYMPPHMPVQAGQYPSPQSSVNYPQAAFGHQIPSEKVILYEDEICALIDKVNLQDPDKFCVENAGATKALLATLRKRLVKNSYTENVYNLLTNDLDYKTINLLNTLKQRVLHAKNYYQKNNFGYESSTLSKHFSASIKVLFPAHQTNQSFDALTPSSGKTVGSVTHLYQPSNNNFLTISPLLITIFDFLLTDINSLKIPEKYAFSVTQIPAEQGSFPVLVTPLY